MTKLQPRKELEKENELLIITRAELLTSLKSLTNEINLNKLNIKKDFSLINAHACALKIIHKTQGY